MHEVQHSSERHRKVSHSVPYVGRAPFNWTLIFYVTPEDPGYFLVRAEIELEGTVPFSIRSSEERATYEQQVKLVFSTPHELSTPAQNNPADDFAGSRVRIKNNVSDKDNEINVTLCQANGQISIIVNHVTLGPEWIVGARHIILMILSE